MKKIRILLICFAVVALACVIFAGCSKTEQITSIELKDMTPENVIETKIGEFDYSSFTVLINYDSGSVEEIALSEEMISELDRLKFYQAGDHTITVSYGGNTCEFNVSVKRNTFGELKFPENNVFTYDGKEHKVELQGELPANATVSYIGGNSFVNAGVYDVTAVVSCNGYVTERITTTVTVDRAKYDMGNVKLESKEVVYDGNKHSIQITGELPEGIPAPTYHINGNAVSGVSDVGEYSVTAVFSTSDPNYYPIPSLQATLKISPKDYTVGEVGLIFKNEDGGLLFGSSKTYDGKGVAFDIDFSDSLLNSVKVSYTISDESGEVISYSNNHTNIKDAGEYTIKVDFTALDNKNYNSIDPMEFTFTVDKAKYDVSSMYFNSKLVEYNGDHHSISLSIPSELEASIYDDLYDIYDIVYKYYRVGNDYACPNAECDYVYNPVFGDADNLIESGTQFADLPEDWVCPRCRNASKYDFEDEQKGGKEGVCNAGEYKVKAVFCVKDPNYKQIAPFEATLVIEKKKVAVAGFDFGDTTLIYTGNHITPTFEYKAKEYFSVSEISVYKPVGENEYESVEEAIALGKYRAKVTVSLNDAANYVFDNGESEIELTCDYTIIQREFYVSNFTFGNTVLHYTGESQMPSFEFETGDYFDIKISLSKKLEGDEYESVKDAIEIGIYRADVTITLVDTVNYAFDNGEAEIKLTCDFAIKKEEVVLGFVGEHKTTVVLGETVEIMFEYTKIEGLLTVYQNLYRLEGEDFVALGDGKETVAWGSAIEIYSEMIGVGKYKFIVLAELKDNLYYSLPGGAETAEYYLEFEIVDAEAE